MSYLMSFMAMGFFCRHKKLWGEVKQRFSYANLLCIWLHVILHNRNLSMHVIFCQSKEGYLQLASISFGQNKRLFRVRPKTHMLAEIGLAMLELGQNNRCCLSPIATCTWSDEDFIGRVSRCARSTHGATISVSTMNKCLGMYSLQLKHLATKKRSWTCRMSPGKCRESACGRSRWEIWIIVGKLHKTTETPKTTRKQELLLFSRRMNLQDIELLRIRMMVMMVVAGAWSRSR